MTSNPNVGIYNKEKKSIQNTGTYWMCAGAQDGIDQNSHVFFFVSCLQN